ncbi:hypothetical protein [Mucilaginibacter ginsenosidivorans]|nr:hypothetical protein [Mucilaginibacter ginsenosidivorans]
MVRKKKELFHVKHEAIIKDAGHWIVQEQTAQVQKGLLGFFLK